MEPSLKPLKPLSVAELTAQWSHQSEPLVSIICATYQHEQFINDAINGFLGQKTVFPFEILIRDDASTDGTQEIIQCYAKRYRGIVIPVLETENRYPEVKPTCVLAKRAKGTYLAFCEGDDYWTDPLKLQKQIDFHQLNPDHAMSFHYFTNVIDERDPIEKSNVNEPVNSLLVAPRFCTRIAINVLDGMPNALWAAPNGDQVIKFFLEDYGKIAFLPDIKPAVHRVHPGGVMSAVTNLARSERRLRTWEVVEQVYRGKPRYKAAKRRRDQALVGNYLLRISESSDIRRKLSLVIEAFFLGVWFAGVRSWLARLLRKSFRALRNHLIIV